MNSGYTTSSRADPDACYVTYSNQLPLFNLISFFNMHKPNLNPNRRLILTPLLCSVLVLASVINEHLWTQ